MYFYTVISWLRRDQSNYYPEVVEKIWDTVARDRSLIENSYASWQSSCERQLSFFLCHTWTSSLNLVAVKKFSAELFPFDLIK